jgi:hypothetical protein
MVYLPFIKTINDHILKHRGEEEKEEEFKKRRWLN